MKQETKDRIFNSLSLGAAIALVEVLYWLMKFPAGQDLASAIWTQLGWAVVDAALLGAVIYMIAAAANGKEQYKDLVIPSLKVGGVMSGTLMAYYLVDQVGLSGVEYMFSAGHIFLLEMHLKRIALAVADVFLFSLVVFLITASMLSIKRRFGRQDKSQAVPQS